MKKIVTIILLSTCCLSGFCQSNLMNLFERMGGDNVKRTELEVIQAYDSATYNRSSIWQTKLQIGRHQGVYQVITTKNKEPYGIIKLGKINISLKSAQDAIDGHKMASEILLPTLSAFSIKFRDKHYLCLNSVNSTLGSFALYMNMYIIDLATGEIHFFNIKYGTKFHFGDFNNDGVLDVIKPKRYDHKLKLKKNEYYMDSYELNAYTLDEGRFKPLEHQKYRVRVLIKDVATYKITDYQWFY